MVKITVFCQLQQLCSGIDFEKCSQKYFWGRKRDMTPWNLFLSLLLAQLADCTSFRDIAALLFSHSSKNYHNGIKAMSKSTLSRASERFDYRMFADYAQILLQRCRAKAPSHHFRFRNNLFSADSTTIPLCLSSFDWAHFRLVEFETGTGKSELRLVAYYDKEKKETYVYLTNNTKLAARTIADIYKDRWKIELFFKELKGNLKIRTFMGTSENAVKLQIYVALCAYLLLKLLQFTQNLHLSAAKIKRIITSALFLREPMINLFRKPPDPQKLHTDQLLLVIT